MIFFLTSIEKLAAAGFMRVALLHATAKIGHYHLSLKCNFPEKFILKINEYFGAIFQEILISHD